MSDVSANSGLQILSFSQESGMWLNQPKLELLPPTHI